MADLGSAKVKTPGSRAADSNDEKAKSNQRTTAVPLNEVIGHESAKKELLSVGLTELLDLDDRPVFILDITSATRSNPVYYNPSLREITILELKIGKGIATSSREAARDPTYLAFSEWATSTRNGDLSDATYCGLRWNAKTIRGRWRVISGDVGHHDTGPAAARRQSEIPRLGRTQTQTFPLEPPGDQSRPTYPPRDKHDTLEAQLAQLRLRSEENIQTFPSLPGTEPRFSRKVNTKESETLGRIDFTRPNPSAVLSSHIQFVLDFDWGATLLGPIHSWPPELRRMANILMSDPRPAAMYWGKQRTMMYNEAYLPVIGQKHPGVMGKLFSEAWAEVEKDFTPAFEKAAETGTPFVIDEARFYIQRNGYLEETYHSISIIPFSVDHGEVGL
jgi:PAS domain-containing protein